MTEQEEREYVEKVWPECEAKWLPSMPYRFRVEMRYDSDMVWADLKGSGFFKTDSELTEQRAWHAAYLFTVERQRQIKEVEEEIQWIAGVVYGRAHFNHPAVERILAVEQQRLADLQRGMKGGEQ
jgi:hypothetical protein